MSNNLRQYFAKDDVAATCVSKFLQSLSLEAHQTVKAIIEISCGDGVFLKPLKQIEAFQGCDIVAIDIAPGGQNDEMTLSDYLALQLNYTPSLSSETVVIGNPPFGEDGKISRQFLESSTKISDYIALILPSNFSSPSVYMQIVPLPYQLIMNEDLEEETFEMSNGTLYRVGACFQIWHAIRA